MFLLVPAHPGFPGQIPQIRKTVVCVCVCGNEGKDDIPVIMCRPSLPYAIGIISFQLAYVWNSTPLGI